MKLNPVIEVYFDPVGHLGGVAAGCYRARLGESYGCHSAGMTPEEAVRDLIRTIKSFADYADMPLAQENYLIVRLSPYFVPMDIPWNQLHENKPLGLVREILT